MRQIETNAYCNLKQTHSHSHTFHIHTFTFSHLHFQTFPFHSDTFTDTLSLAHFLFHTFTRTFSVTLSLTHFKLLHCHTFYPIGWMGSILCLIVSYCTCSVPKSPVFRRARPSRWAFVENRPSCLFVILPVFCD